MLTQHTAADTQMLSSFGHSCHADDDHAAAQCNTNKQNIVQHVDQSTQLLDDNASETRKKLSGRQVNIKSIPSIASLHQCTQCIAM